MDMIFFAAIFEINAKIKLIMAGNLLGYDL
jgi:hypothetical protein